MDNITKQRIEKLHPSVRNEILQIVSECDKALTGRAKVRIAQGMRTFAEQDALYKQRPKVTNAKGGQSIHNYGLAVDIVLIIDGKTASWDTAKDWDNDKISDWMEVVKIFKSHGWNWGGDWKSFKDLPHFEKAVFVVKGKQIKTDWKNLKDLPRDKDGYIIQ
jgi:peptidoglycan L-alanyl-D-glutamate endopeptidase CwlK